MRFAFFLITLTGLVSADLRTEIEPFLESHCYSCHDDFDAEADLNLLDLPFDPSNPENRKIWERVFERVETGEMPPKKKKRPEAGDLASFLKTMEAPLIEADRQGDKD